jgi:hypothetical protein
MCDTCAVKYWGPIENRPVKKNFSWYTADARTSTLELRNKADAQPSTLVQLHRIYLLRVQDADFHQVQFICEALYFLEGANNESFLSCNEPIAAVLSEVSFGVQGGLLLVKPLVFRLQYRLSTEEEAIDGGKFGWFGMVAVSELPEFKALGLICASSPIFSP